MKHLIKNNQIIESGIPSHFTRANGESFWGGYENMTDLHAEDGWVESIIPIYDPILQNLGEPYYDIALGKVTYNIIPRELPSLTNAKVDKILELKSMLRELLIPTDGYIIRRSETGKSVPQTILTNRQNIRLWSDTVEKDINSLTSIEEVLQYNIEY